MMSESVGGPPAQIKPHTTVSVITDPGPAPASLEIRLNIGYFKTLQGIIKLVELASHPGPPLSWWHPGSCTTLVPGHRGVAVTSGRWTG